MQDERAVLAKHAGSPGDLGPVEAFMAAIAAVPRAAQRLQAARLQRSFAERLADAQASAKHPPDRQSVHERSHAMTGIYMVGHVSCARFGRVDKVLQCV